MRLRRPPAPAWRARADELRARAPAARQEEQAAEDRYEAFGVLDPSTEWSPEYEEARRDVGGAWVEAETARHELYAFLHPRRYARKGYQGARLLRNEHSPQQPRDLVSQPDPQTSITTTSRPDPDRPRSSAPAQQPDPDWQPYSQAEDPDPEPEDGRSFLAMLPGTAIGHLLHVWDLDSLIPDTKAMARELIARAAEATPGRSIGFALLQQPGPATISPHATSSGSRPWVCGNKAWFTLTAPDDPAPSARMTEPEPEPETGA